MHCEMTIFVFTTRMPVSGVPAASVPARSAPCSC
jgi:hypothetical protein